MPVDVTSMVAPRLLVSQTLIAPEDLTKFDLLPHPDWEKWFARAERPMPSGLRFAAVGYSIFELIANTAVAGQGVGLRSPALFQPAGAPRPRCQHLTFEPLGEDASTAGHSLAPKHSWGNSGKDEGRFEVCEGSLEDRGDQTGIRTSSYPLNVLSTK